MTKLNLCLMVVLMVSVLLVTMNPTIVQACWCGDGCGGCYKSPTSCKEDCKKQYGDNWASRDYTKA